MDKYEKLIGAIILIAVISSVTYFIAIIVGIITTDFPFFIFIPSWGIICIPIITQKRLEEKRKQEIFK
ncbi:MAG: hypothetical protein ACFFB0_03510 [Promethearchaeota archaeon]